MPETITPLLLPVPVEGDTPDVPRDIKALAERLGLALPAQKSIIATEQERTNTAFGTLATPDEVTVTLPENGLIAIAYVATWAASTAEGAEASIFLGANQIKIPHQQNGTGQPVPQAAFFFNNQGQSGVFAPLMTTTYGLVGIECGAGSYTGDATTGQIVGNDGSFSAISQFNNAGKQIMTLPIGGPVLVHAAAGTYKITVQFKAPSGSVKVKNRKLWAWVVS